MPIITACSQDCPDTCFLGVETSPSGKVRINGNPDHPFTAGFCCAKLKSWHRRLSSIQDLATERAASWLSNHFTYWWLEKQGYGRVLIDSDGL